ncbi:extensin-2-like [Pyrus ussuriensis x Pyrus communis]|uniref:Extensin-2-like n=1 Tax=Pyrus ussuriensis x Pyrus communis TaxID=2448454 RepID=A0A5N5G6C4_9ROSA|nr:extensin-2-like [Pyrus ussuriensis x Pyrus communis]
MAYRWRSLAYALAVCLIATNVAASYDKPYVSSSPPVPASSYLPPYSYNHHLHHLPHHHCIIMRLLHDPLIITKQLEFLFSSCSRLVAQIISARESFILVTCL